jgi:hypothetical protein
MRANALCALVMAAVAYAAPCDDHCANDVNTWEQKCGTEDSGAWTYPECYGCSQCSDPNAEAAQRDARASAGRPQVRTCSAHLQREHDAAERQSVDWSRCRQCVRTAASRSRPRDRTIGMCRLPTGHYGGFSSMDEWCDDLPPLPLKLSMYDPPVSDISG